MKKLFLTVLLLMMFVPLFSQEYESPMTMYRDNFIIAGDDEDQVKFQFSAKYNIFYPSSTGIYFGYTQLNHWFVYDNRDTFYSMYQPEVFYRFESGHNIFGDVDVPLLDYIQLSPYYHCSTGVEGPDHRGIDTYYGQIQLSVGETVNLGANLKVFKYYHIEENNKDINDYRKNYQADFFLKIRSKQVSLLDKEELHCIIGGNPRGKGFIQGELVFRIITAYIQPRFFIQYYHGYDEFMVDYNKKTTAVRAGLIF